jgi:hypothetical protein
LRSVRPQSDQLAQLVLGALALSELSQGSRSRSTGQLPSSCSQEAPLLAKDARNGAPQIK